MNYNINDKIQIRNKEYRVTDKYTELRNAPHVPNNIFNNYKCDKPIIQLNNIHYLDSNKKLFYNAYEDEPIQLNNIN